MEVKQENVDIEKLKGQFFSEEKDMLLLAKVVSLTMFILGMIMAITCHIEENTSMVIVSLIYGPLFLISLIVTVITKKSIFFQFLGYILSFVMEIVFLISGGQEGFGIFWMCITTLFTFFANKKRLFYVVNSVYILLVLLAFWTPPYPSFVIHFQTQ